MSVQFSSADLIGKNDKALEACNLTIERLEGMLALPSSLERKRLAQLSRATNQVTQLEQMNAHLRAAATTVSPMAEQTANELNALGNKLEQHIATNAILSATIDFVKDVLDDTNKVRDIITGHS